jgi:hypothetical protein
MQIILISKNSLHILKLFSKDHNLNQLNFLSKDILGIDNTPINHFIIESSIRLARRYMIRVFKYVSSLSARLMNIRTYSREKWHTS